MAATKVLVVDDSLTMRVLISGALERIPNVKVVGLADGADEARGMVEQFHPDVMTLDVEMPGTSGMQYLAEIMEKRPMPVIMFSSRTQAGDAHSVEALRLGAIECFPKPKVAVPVELDKIIEKLGKCIKAAKGKAQAGGTAATPKPIAVAPAIDWNGRVLAIGGDASSTKAIGDLLATFPANAPPTVVVQHLEASVAETMARSLDEQIAPRIVIAEDGMAVEQGTIYLAPASQTHIVVDGWPRPTIRRLARDPVAGQRPSVSVLFASLARAAMADSVALTFTAGAEDGRAGIDAVLAGGGHVVEGGAGGFALKRKQMAQPVAAADVARTLLKLCSR